MLLVSTTFAIHNLGQTHFIKNLRIFADISKQDIKILADEGHCSGISALWLYYKGLKSHNRLTSSLLLRFPTENFSVNDPDWFTSTVELISAWDGKRELNKEETARFKRLISLVEYYQNIEQYLPSTSQVDLDHFLDCPVNKKIKKEYSIASVLTLAQLKILLRMQNIIQDGKLICIQSYEHATALFKEGEKYYYFDPNNKSGEIETTSSDEVAELIFKAFWFDPTKSSPLNFVMFVFDENTSDDTPTARLYPSQKEVLDIIKPSLGSEKGYMYEYTGLMIAAGAGSIESLRYFLACGTDPNIQGQGGNTALILAAECNCIAVVKELLANEKVDPNIKNHEGKTALTIARENNYTAIVEELLASKKIDPNL